MGKATKTEQTPVIAFKGFDRNFQCRGFQFAAGKTYEHSGVVERCESGFHACESPLDVWGYYGPFDSRFAIVELAGELSREDGGDSKIAAGKITVKAELKLPEFIGYAVKAIIDACKGKGDEPGGDYAQIGSSGGSAKIGSSGDYAQIGSSGDYAQIGSSGYYAQIGSSGDSAKIGSSGNCAQIGSSGYYAQIGSSGDSAQIGSSGRSAKIGSSGDYAQIGSSGDYAQIGSSGYSAKIGSSGYSAKIGSSGYYARIGSSGDSAQIGSSGDYAQIKAEGRNAVIACAGSVEAFEVGDGGCICIPYHDGERTRFAVGYVGEGLKSGVRYTVSAEGRFVEAE